MNLQHTKKKEEVDLVLEQPLVVLPMPKIIFYVSMVCAC